MKILLVHNRYRERGGEDVVVDATAALLREHGHTVALYLRHNDDLQGMSNVKSNVKSNVNAAVGALWSRRTTLEVGALLQEFRPDLVHAHNTFPLISPSLYACVARAGVPLVQTVHNFRLACPQAMFLRDGKVCEDCLGKVPWRAVQHACYRGSRMQSAVVLGMTQLHRSLGTWQRHVARFIALSEFSRNKLVQAGLPAQRISVLGQFVADLPPLVEAAAPRGGLLFVGRLAPEKGLSVLVKALAMARKLMPDMSITVVGDGPEAAALQGVPGLRLLGNQPLPEVLRAMRHARALLMPSQSYENFPRTLVEAFACGTPVVASRLGALAELVQDEATGWHVDANDISAWAQRLTWVNDAANDSTLALVGQRARAQYLAHYTPAAHHAGLMQAYQAALDGAQGRSK